MPETLTWEVAQADVKKYSPSAASRKSRAAAFGIQELLQKSKKARNKPSLKHISQATQLFDFQLSDSQLPTQKVVLHLHRTLQISLNFGGANIIVLRLKSPGDREKEDF